MTNSDLKRDSAVMIDHAVCKVFLSWIARYVLEGQYRDGGFVWEGRSSL